MTEYDVVVAGGGPSGLQFAREISRRTQYSIAVLEANDELSDNDKSTGGTFHQVVDGFGIPDRVIMDSSDHVIFEGPEAGSRIQLRNYVLDFPAFLEYLGADAAEHGAQILTGRRVTEPVTEDGVVNGVKCRGGRETVVEADLVVDATGPAGALTRQLGMWNRTAAQRGIGKEFEIEGRFDESAMLFRFDHGYAPGGYAWVFPAGEGVFKAGVCWIDDFYAGHSPDDDGSIDSYVHEWVESDPRWAADRIRDIHAGEAVSDNSMNQRARDGLIAVGDAVSSINPLFGEGIRPAMESARMAADVAIDALDADTPTRETLAAYERRWNSLNGSNWKTQRIAGELLYDFDADQQNGFVRRVGQLSDGQVRRLQEYNLTIRDLQQLYPFKPGDISKVPTLLRHLR
jgi:digeranylgeranylglycerophospholipid reductase